MAWFQLLACHGSTGYSPGKPQTSLVISTWHSQGQNISGCGSSPLKYVGGIPNLKHSRRKVTKEKSWEAAVRLLTCGDSVERVKHDPESKRTKIKEENMKEIQRSRELIMSIVLWLPNPMSLHWLFHALTAPQKVLVKHICVSLIHLFHKTSAIFFGRVNKTKIFLSDEFLLVPISIHRTPIDSSH